MAIPLALVRDILTADDGKSISVGTMGSVGAAAPTIIGQWVQAMYSAPTITKVFGNLNNTIR